MVVWKTIETLNGSLFALILGAVCVTFSTLIRLNFFYQPTSFDVLAWTTLYFVVIKYIKSEKSIWLYVGSLVFAVGFLNKYDIVFLMIGLFPALIVTEQRKIFSRISLYFSLALALLFILPNLAWQYNNSFPVFHHLNELATTQLVNVNRWDFLKQQLFYNVGSLLVIIGGLYALLFYEPFSKYKLFFWSILCTLVFFLYLRAKGYYALGLYPIYISFGSVFIGNMIQPGWKNFLKPIAIAVPILFYFLLFRLFFTNQSPAYVVVHEQEFKRLGLLGWEDGKDHLMPQDFADMLGWEELAKKVDEVYRKFPNQHQTMVLCDNYGQAGAINYYSTIKNIRAVSFNADYINWMELNDRIENFIRVKEFNGSENELAETAPFFNIAFVADSISNPLAREYRTKIFIYTKPKIDINKRLKAEVKKKKRFEY